MKNLFLAASITLILYSCTNNSNKRNLEQGLSSQSDSCKWFLGYNNDSTINCEGLMCNKRREGIWKDWYSSGLLKDSGKYIHGHRVYNDSLLKNLSATIVFKNNPLQFYKDSDYLFYLNANTYFHYLDITASFENMSVNEGRKKIYLLQIDEAAEDSFNYVLTPKKAGRIKVMFNVQEYAEGQHNRYPLFGKEITILEK